jgi:hypothetical protein
VRSCRRRTIVPSESEYIRQGGQEGHLPNTSVILHTSMKRAPCAQLKTTLRTAISLQEATSDSYLHEVRTEALYIGLHVDLNIAVLHNSSNFPRLVLQGAQRTKQFIWQVFAGLAALFLKNEAAKQGGELRRGQARKMAVEK